MSREVNDTAKGLMLAFHRFRNREAATNNDCRRTEARILLMLSDHGDNGLKVSELGKLMRVTSPFVTQLVNQLEARGLVIRRQDPQDGRIVRIVPTPSGLDEAKELKRIFYRRFTDLVEELGEDEARTLTQLLNKAFDIMEQKNGMFGRTAKENSDSSEQTDRIEED
ncbi:MarR family winged helix-turn-helix transcriptional regulator [Paenibacillus chartarius]|uniref:MarR family winged helix-turn-helix transcriptional regulator n=1 Tax=Paenibacillus chartarius TaxID=747481 RepID=A0ABV6DTN2_9BACL